MGRLNRMTREEGFTLVELMIVILIIGILVSIAVASYIISLRATKRNVCLADIRIIEEQIAVYRTDHDANPPDLASLVPDYIEQDSSLYCPETGEAYEYDPVSGDVSCPVHGEP